MSAHSKERASRKAIREDGFVIPEQYRHSVAIAALVLSIFIFLFPVMFGGKTFLGPDSIASHSFDTLIADAKEQGMFPLWNPYIFCGMPAYGSLTLGGERMFDVSAWIFGSLTRVFQVALGDGPVTWVVFYYLIFAVGMYLFAWSRLKNELAAFVAAFGATFSMFIIIWIMVSHNTKISTVAFFPYLLFFADRLRERFRWLWAFLAVLVFHFVYLPSHVQMIFYIGLALAGYFIMAAVQAARKKEAWAGVLRSAAILVVAAAIAFLMDADKYLSVLEYNPYSIRGSAPLIQQQSGPSAKTKPGGLDYDYATQWSLAPGEMMTFFVPTWYGFGHLTYSGPLTTQPIRFNGYWGPQPFTDGAQYMGVVVTILAFIGFVKNRKDPFVMYMGVMIVVSLLVAFGKELPVLYDPMFAYFPMFNKFRIPSMILVLVQIFVPILAAYGITSLMAMRKDGLSPAADQRWKRIVVGLAVGVVASVVLRSVIGGIYKGFFPIQEVGGILGRQFGQVQPQVIGEFYNYVVDIVLMDITIALGACTLVFGAFWLYGRRMMQTAMFTAILVGVIGADLWRIALRPMDPQPKQDHTAIFTAPDYVRALQTDSTLYRTLTFQNGQLPYDNTLAYWRVQSAYGYQGAKMRAYQDMVDIAGMNNPLVWQLMNVKYVISNTPDSSVMFERAFKGGSFDVYRFRGALPRAFFVSRVEASNPEQTMNAIANRSFNPLEVAYVTEAPSSPIEPPGPGASAIVTHFGIQDLELKVTATGTNFLFLSETYYPVGWHAFLDGKEIPIHRTNYLFRGVTVPSGEHTLTMAFTPSGFTLGKNLSLGANIVVLGGLLFVGWTEWKRRKSAHS